MKTNRTGTSSGCIVWVIVFGILSTCLFPTAIVIGGVTSASNFAMQFVGPLIFPNGETFETYSYSTTTTDEYGNTQPSTAYELQCVDVSGEIIKKDPILYAFLWMRTLAVIGFVIAGSACKYLDFKIAAAKTATRHHSND